MQENSTNQKINFSINAEKVPVLYVDSYLIGSNEDAVTLNFGQAVMGQNQQQIVARVALTTKQAKEFLKNLDDHIQKFEV